MLAVLGVVIMLPIGILITPVCDVASSDAARPRHSRVVCLEPSELQQLKKRLLELENKNADKQQQLKALRQLEQSQLEQQRQDLEQRQDLSADAIAARRLSEAVAKQEPSLLPSEPSPELSPHDVVLACMVAMQENDVPDEVARAGEDWGYRYNWQFFSGMVRANWRGDVDEFVREEKNNLNGIANCDWFETEEATMMHIAGTATRGAIVKVVVAVRCRDAVPMASRKFLWTLQQERRPPQVGCWLITSVLAMDRALDQLTM